MIRKATVQDAETIALYNANLAKETENIDLDLDTVIEGVKAILTDPSKGRYFVYEQDGQVVGQIAVTFEWSDWRNGQFWWIQSVYVHKLYRRQGIFQSLYKHIKDLVSANPSICGLRLYVEKENEPAQSTYKKLEMEETHYFLYEWEK
ncbi:GNAT family N-acetyltransferase [Haloplasma contractile]|uniref:Acteyltransferase GNAT family protein n=1 Tax=Haloplasma contractile SSD-17B TaxID=1033810 RepID=F7Q225_9MOLU|nr:N-acetyltransferase [Haloplasma contractile]ERJ12167.1 Acteyltransferase GNAT family protein [Haloplasma contractile SSD-17B]